MYKSVTISFEITDVPMRHKPTCGPYSVHEVTAIEGVVLLNKDGKIVSFVDPDGVQQSLFESCQDLGDRIELQINEYDEHAYDCFHVDLKTRKNITYFDPGGKPLSWIEDTAYDYGDRVEIIVEKDMGILFHAAKTNNTAVVYTDKEGMRWSWLDEADKTTDGNILIIASNNEGKSSSFVVPKGVYTAI